MKASPAMQAILMDVADIDLNIARGEQELQRLMKGEAIAVLRDTLAALSETFLNVRNAEENMIQEIRKVAGDLESVEKRIAHDQVLVNSSSSAKDIGGIEHELKSLHQRKSDLEDVELELLEQLDGIKEQRVLSESVKAKASEQLASSESAVESSITTARSTIALAQQQKANKIALLPDELADVYLRLSGRGVAVARLEARDCGSCRIALTAAAYDDVMATPADEIVSCPNCQAILIRQ